MHVASLSRGAREEDLESAFGRYGKLAEVQIMRDPRSQEPRGFAFVTFENVEDAAKAIDALDGTALLGRTITVQRARRSGARDRTPGQYLGPPKRGVPPERHDRAYDSKRDRGGSSDRGYRETYRREAPMFHYSTRNDYGPPRDAPRGYDHVYDMPETRRDARRARGEYAPWGAYERSFLQGGSGRDASPAGARRPREYESRNDHTR